MYIHLKRLLDVVCIVLASPVWIPLMVILSLAVKFSSRGSVLFKQKRIGKDGSFFMIYKFRSMYIDAPKDIPTHLLENPNVYITPIGQFLRKFSLDELPQIFNVIKGEITLVGPRPALWNQNDLIAEREKYGANNITPGLTGLAQISGRDELPIVIKAKYDGEYKKAMCFWLDIKILFYTFFAVFKSDGVLEGGTGSADLKKVLILDSSTVSLWRFRKEVIAALIDDGWNVMVCSVNDGFLDSLTSIGINFIEISVDRHGINPIHDFILMRNYGKIMREVRPSLVLTYTIKPNIYGNLAAKSLKIPVVSTITGLGISFIDNNIVGKMAKKLYRSAFKSVACVVFQNNEDENIMRCAGIIKKQTVLKVPGSGVNLSEYRCCPLPESKLIRFLYSGRIMRSKGVLELLEAAASLRDNPLCSFELILAGSYDGDIEVAVKEAQDKGIVKHIGYVNDMSEMLKSCHCVVLPSYKEGMSNALLEAAAVGRPLIASNVSGCREIVEDGVNGFLCMPCDAESLYISMKRFLDLSFEKIVEMGSESRCKVEAEFDRQIVVVRMVEKVNEFIKS